MRFFNYTIGGLLAVAMAIGLVTAQAQTGRPAPFVTVTTTTSGTPIQQIVSANTSRLSIQICNVGTNVIWIWPGPISPAVSALELPALSSGTTVCFSPPTGAAGDKGGASAAWNMESVTSGVGTASVFEW